MNPRIKRVLRIAVIIAIVIAIGIPSVLYIKEKQPDPEEKVTVSFLLNYGQQGNILSINKAKNIYIIQWESNAEFITSLYIEGLWIELGRNTKQLIEPGGE